MDNNRIIEINSVKFEIDLNMTKKIIIKELDTQILKCEKTYEVQNKEKEFFVLRGIIYLCSIERSV